jgi:hypothetical protein
MLPLGFATGFLDPFDLRSGQAFARNDEVRIAQEFDPILTGLFPDEFPGRSSGKTRAQRVAKAILDNH